MFSNIARITTDIAQSRPLSRPIFTHLSSLSSQNASIKVKVRFITTSNTNNKQLYIHAREEPNDLIWQITTNNILTKQQTATTASQSSPPSKTKPKLPSKKHKLNPKTTATKNYLQTQKRDYNAEETKLDTNIKSLISRKEQKQILKKSNEIVLLLLELTKGATSDQLRFKQNDFQRVFNICWLRTELPLLEQQLTGENDLENQQKFELFIHELTNYKYINLSKKISKFLREIIYEDKYKQYRTLEVYNCLLDFFSNKQDSNSLVRIKDMMDVDNIKANAMSFNLIAKNTLSGTTLQLDRLLIWKAILLHMKEQKIQPDLASFYITLSVLPYNAESKQRLKTHMIENGLRRGVKKFSDIELNDMLQDPARYSCSLMREYYESCPVNEVDYNCMNTMIYKILRTNAEQGGGFSNAWKFMESQWEERQIKPRNSTITIFLKYAKIHKDLKMMMVIINTMYQRYGLVNYQSNRLILKYLIKFKDDDLPDWWYDIVKFVKNFHFEKSIDRARRIDVLQKQLDYKIQLNEELSLKTNVNMATDSCVVKEAEGKLFDLISKTLILQDASDESLKLLTDGRKATEKGGGDYDYNDDKWLIDLIDQAHCLWLNELMNFSSEYA